MKVLLLGAGGAATNGVARALKLAGGFDLVGANCSETDLLLSECDENHLIAPASDPERWCVDIDRVIRQTKPAFIHAQNDGEVEALGAFRRIAGMNGARTWLPRQETIRRCRDKLVSQQIWRRAGVPVPETHIVDGRGILFAMTTERDTEAWIRPRTGAGGQRSLRTRNPRLAQEWMNHHNGWGEFTIAEALTADTVTVQQLYWKGHLVCSQQRTRESWANAGSSATGVSGSTGVGVTSSDPEVDDMADLAVRVIDANAHGLYGVDLCRDHAGTPCVTEINIGRFFTTAPEFYATAGFNMAARYVSFGENAYYLHDHGVGWPPMPGTVRNPLPDGLRWIRSMDRPPMLDRSQVREPVAA